MKKFMVKVNGNQYEVEVEEVIDQSVAVQPENKQVDKSTSLQSNASSSASGSSTISAPMPGTIIKTSVHVGDNVTTGQVLVILEAMKMENEITATKNGKITLVNVKEGQSVNAGDVLVTIE